MKSPKATLGASALLLAVALSAARADNVDDFVKAEIAKRHIPGLTLAVARDGKLELARGYGQVDIELSVPASEKSIYEIGSMTKQFTATAVMMLVEEGKLKLDDKI